MSTNEVTQSLLNVDSCRCTLCAGFFDDPLLLPCLHTFCSKCLESSVEKPLLGAQSDKIESTVNNAVVCPLCRESVQLNGGLDSLPANTFLAKTAKLRRLEAEKKTKQLSCSACSRHPASVASDPTAVAYCAECADTLCKACSDAHRKLRLTESHSLIELMDNDFTVKVESILKSAVLPVCSLHQTQPLTLYCHNAECVTPICANCALKQHKNHNFVEIAEIAGEQLGTLLTCVETMGTDLQCVKTEFHRVKMAQQLLDNSREKTEQEISDRTNELNQTVAKTRQDLQELVNYVHLDKMNRIGKVEDKLKRSKETTENVMAVSSELASRGSDVEVCSLAKKCIIRAHQLLDAPDISLPEAVQLVFQPSTKFESAIEFQPARLFGTVETIRGDNVTPTETD